jgi:competence protein ComEA
MSSSILKQSFLPIAAISLMALSLGSRFLQAQDSGAAEATLPPAPVNINEADADTLAASLQGVGESRARAIVEYRDEHGPFMSVEELTEVNGIGEATLLLNRARISIE